MRNARWQLVGGLALLALWQMLAWSRIWPHYLFPSPADVAVTLVRLARSGELLTAVLVTLSRILLGFGLSSLMGMLTGMALARWPRVSAAVGPIVQGLQSLPSICWFPLAILWFGLNEWAILFVTMVGTLFAVASATESAIRHIPPGYLRAAATMGAKGWKLYSRVIIPATLPTLLTGLRMGWSFAWRSLMAAELLFMNLGLGHLLGMGRELADAAQVVAIILTILAMGMLVDRLIFARSERNLRKRWGFEAAA